MSLEEALDFIDTDELLEVTPQSLRIRKKNSGFQDEKKRKTIVFEFFLILALFVSFFYIIFRIFSLFFIACPIIWLYNKTIKYIAKGLET